MAICDTCGCPLAEDSPFAVCPQCLFRAALEVPAQQPEPPNLVKPVSPALRRLPQRADFFAKYELLRRVERGGQGEIWEVRDHELRRHVAMKRLHDEAVASEPGVYRFLAEAQITSQMDHPGILPIFEVGLDPDGRPFYTTQLVGGNTLAALIQAEKNRAPAHLLLGTPQSSREFLERFIRICEVIEYAHHRGVIHRDLKPSNILVGDYGDVRVIDWGSAHILPPARKRFDSRFVELKGVTPETDRAEATETLGGSPLATANAGQPITTLFMPPEVLSREDDALGPQTDIYSLGVMLYEFLAGRCPYSTSEGTMPPAEELRNQILAGPPARLREINRSTSRDLAAICERAMARSRSSRYATIAELGEDLRAVLQIRPVKARPRSALLSVEKWSRRNIQFVATACLSLTVLAIVLSVARGLKAERDATRQINLVRNAELAARSGRWRDALRNWNDAEAAGYHDHIYLDLQRAQAWTILNQPRHADALLTRLNRRHLPVTAEGAVLLRMGEHELFEQKTSAAGLRHVREALAMDLSPADRAFASGLVATNTQAALVAFRQALRFDPYHHAAHRHSLGLELLLGRHEELATHLQVFRTLYPEDISAAPIAAMRLALNGKLSEAKAQWAIFNTATASDKDSSRVARSLQQAAAFAEFCQQEAFSSFTPGSLPKAPMLESFGDFAGEEQGVRVPFLPCVRNGLMTGFDGLRALANPFLTDAHPAIAKVKAGWRQHPESSVPFRAALLLEQRRPGSGPGDESVRQAQVELLQLAADSPSMFPDLRPVARFFAAELESELIKAGATNAVALRNACLANMRVSMKQSGFSPAQYRCWTTLALEMKQYGLANGFLAEWKSDFPQDSAISAAEQQLVQMKLATSSAGIPPD